MGIYSDLLSGAQTIDTGLNDDDAFKVSGDKVATREIQRLQALRDRDYGASFAEADEVQSIAIYSGTVSGGTFTLTFTLNSGQQFTTADIAYDASAATIEGAINTAATAASVPGWVNGDISVAGGDLVSTPVTLTFAGGSVDALNQGLTTIDGTLLTGGGSAGAISTTTNGQSNRAALSTLFAISAIAGTVPAQGVTPTDFTAASNYTNNSLLPDQDTLRRLAREAGHVDKNIGLEHAILDALSLPRRK